MAPPHGVRNLFISCHGSGDGQFQEMHRLLEALGRREGAHALRWDGRPLDLSRRRVLMRVLVSGHGSAERPGFGLAGPLPLTPDLLLLGGKCILYLLGCSQGRPELRSAWARGTGLPPSRVHGCAGETDTALSTCLLLHLLEEGAGSLEGWFPRWVEANDALRPSFPAIRRAYAEQGADPLATLGALRSMPELERFGPFIEVIERHPRFLSRLPVPPPGAAPLQGSRQRSPSRTGGQRDPCPHRE